MKRSSYNIFAAVTIAIGLFLFSAADSSAIHKGAGDLVCGGCHTMHNSQGNITLDTSGLPSGGSGGGSFILLRAQVNTRAEIHKLCLQCHGTNGAQATVSQAPQNVQAPKVYSSAAWAYTDAFNKIGAGGNFSPELNASWDASTAATLGYGHSLGATAVTPPGGDAALTEFSCTNCHDPHGTSDTGSASINIYRNLRVSATGAGANSGVKFYSDYTSANLYYLTLSYVGGVSIPDTIHASYFGGTEKDNGNNVIWPVYRGNLTANVNTDRTNSNSYATGDEGATYKTMSRWCVQCHDNWHEDITTTNKVVDAGEFGTDDYRTWRRHPVSAQIPRWAAAGCASGCHKSALDRTNYSNALITQGKGLPVTAGSQMGPVPNGIVYYLPFEFGGGMENSWPGGIDTAHKVFCLSCHFAHGGPYWDNLRWPHLESVETGGQIANPITDSMGCQLCHLRGGA